MDYLAQLERRIARIERQLQFANKELVGTVTNNEDPDGRNRVKVQCSDVYGDSGESPWLTDQTLVSGASRGVVNTPKLGDRISFRLRDGEPDAGDYFGGPRDAESVVPEEFEDTNINGEKTESGILIVKDDNTGEYSMSTLDGASKLILRPDGTVDAYGVTFNAHSSCNFNSDNPQFGVVTDSPAHVCPLTGKPHLGSTTVKASI